VSFCKVKWQHLLVEVDTVFIQPFVAESVSELATFYDMLVGVVQQVPNE